MVNIGVAGCGWIAEHAHIPSLINNNNVNIKAVFDVNAERVNAISNKFSIKYAFDNFFQFLECGLDGIIIATPNYTHVPYTLEALKRGIGVLCEKPVALKVTEIEEIIENSKKYNANYIPGFVNRWRQDIQIVHSVISEGKIGKIESVDAGWIRKNGVPRPGTWFTNQELAGGGVLVDLGSHIIDICLMFIGDATPIKYDLLTSACTVNKVSQSGAAEWFKSQDPNEFTLNVEDSAIAKIQFDSDIMMSVKLSWLAPTDADYTYFRVKGTNGEITLKTLFGFSNQRLWEEDLIISTIEGKRNERYLDKADNNSKNAFVELLNYFSASLIKEKTDGVGYNDAKKTVMAIENLYKNNVQNEEKVREELMNNSEFTYK